MGVIPIIDSCTEVTQELKEKGKMTRTHLKEDNEDTSH